MAISKPFDSNFFNQVHPPFILFTYFTKAGLIMLNHISLDILTFLPVTVFIFSMTLCSINCVGFRDFLMFCRDFTNVDFSKAKAPVIMIL